MRGSVTRSRSGRRSSQPAAAAEGQDPAYGASTDGGGRPEWDPVPVSDQSTDAEELEDPESGATGRWDAEGFAYVELGQPEELVGTGPDEAADPELPGTPEEVYDLQEPMGVDPDEASDPEVSVDLQEEWLGVDNDEAADLEVSSDPQEVYDPQELMGVDPDEAVDPDVPGDPQEVHVLQEMGSPCGDAAEEGEAMEEMNSPRGDAAEDDAAVEEMNFPRGDAAADEAAVEEMLNSLLGGVAEDVEAAEEMNSLLGDAAEGDEAVEEDEAVEDWGPTDLDAILADDSIQSRPVVRPSAREHATPRRRGREVVTEESQEEKWNRQREERMGLPIYQKRAELTPILFGPVPVCCILGETGSGKSTQVPQIILEEAAARQQPVRVAVTQPRRVAAIGLARRVAFELGEGEDGLGKSVGYRVGGESVPGEHIDYCTVGYLLQLLVNVPEEIQRYTHIVLDEVHERSAESDMLCLVVKLLMCGSPSTTRVVVMSATLQCDLFADYFGQLTAKRPGRIHVGSRCFPVKEHFLDELTTVFGGTLRSGRQIAQRIKEAFSTNEKNNGKKRIDPRHCEKLQAVVLDLAQAIAEPGSTILVFLPGIAEISSLWEDSKFLEESGSYKVYPLHSMIPREEQELVFETPDPNVTNLVLSTDIAESSITLPRVVAVIDLGLHRRVDHDEQRGMGALATKWISRASATQRSGRAGRTQPGLCLRLYTREFFEKTMLPHDPPETASMPLEKLYLQAKQLSDGLAKKVLDRKKNGLPRTAQDIIKQMIQAPETSAITTARCSAADLGCITSPEEQAALTTLGQLCLQLPIPLQLARLVWLGALWGITADAVVLACALSSSDPFSAPSPLFIKEEEAFAERLRGSASARLLFDGGMLSEPLTIRQLFLEWLVQFHQRQWVWGSKEWIMRARRKHTWEFSHFFSLSRGRMEHVVSHVLDLSLRTFRVCGKGSKAAMQLRGLMAGLGYMVNGRGDLSPVSEKSYKPFVTQGVFEEDPGYLKSLLATAFSDQVLIGGYGSVPLRMEDPQSRKSQQGKRLAVQEELRREIVDAGLPVGQTVAFSGGSPAEDVKNYVGFVCAEMPAKVAVAAKHVLVQLQHCGEERWEPLQSRSSMPLTTSSRLPPQFTLLQQYERGFKNLPAMSARAGWTHAARSCEHPCMVHWEWMQPLSGKKGAPLRSEAICERKNAVGWTTHLPRDPVSPLPRVALLAVAAMAQSGEGQSKTFAMGVTLLPAGHMLFVLATAKTGEAKFGLQRLGFTLNGSVAVLHRCLDLPEGTVGPKRWELVRELRAAIRRELSVTPEESPECVQRGRRAPLLRDTGVEARSRALLQAVRSGGEAHESGLDPTPAELACGTVCLTEAHPPGGLSALRPLASWSELSRRRDTLAAKSAKSIWNQPVPEKRPAAPLPAVQGSTAGRKGKRSSTSAQSGGGTLPEAPSSKRQRTADGAEPHAGRGGRGLAVRSHALFALCMKISSLTGSLRTEGERSRLIAAVERVSTLHSPHLDKTQALALRKLVAALLKATLTKVAGSSGHKRLAAALTELERILDIKSARASKGTSLGAPPDASCAGKRVRLHGLKVNQALNGYMGKLERFNAAGGHWIVRLLSQHASVPSGITSVMPANLALAEWGEPPRARVTATAATGGAARRGAATRVRGTVGLWHGGPVARRVRGTVGLWHGGSVRAPERAAGAGGRAHGSCLER